MTPRLRDVADKIAEVIPDEAVAALELEALETLKLFGPGIRAGGKGVSCSILDILDDICSTIAAEGAMEGIDLAAEEGSVARAYLRDAEVLNIILTHAHNTNRNDIALIEQARDRVCS